MRHVPYVAVFTLGAIPEKASSTVPVITVQSAGIAESVKYSEKGVPSSVRKERTTQLCSLQPFCLARTK